MAEATLESISAELTRLSEKVAKLEKKVKKTKKLPKEDRMRSRIESLVKNMDRQHVLHVMSKEKYTAFTSVHESSSAIKDATIEECRCILFTGMDTVRIAYKKDHTRSGLTLEQYAERQIRDIERVKTILTTVFEQESD